MVDKSAGQKRQDRLNAALRQNLKRRKQQGRGRGATALPLENRPSLMNGDAEKSVDDQNGTQTGPDDQEHQGKV